MPLHTVVVIHGVGSTPLGANLSAVTHGLDVEGTTYFERSEVLIDGVAFPVARVNHPKVSRVVEVNWSDIARPSVRNAADYVLRILTSMLTVATSSPGTATRPSKIYAFCYQALLTYCIYPPLIAMLVVVMPRLAWLPAVAGVAVVALVTHRLSLLGSPYRVGWIWAFAITATLTAYFAGWMSITWMVRVTAMLYVGGQAVPFVALVIALVAVIARRQVALDRRIATASLLYLPFFAISAIGAILWAGTLWMAKLGADRGDQKVFTPWEDQYGAALKLAHYHLADFEFAFAAVVGSVGLGILVVAAWYIRRRRTTHAGEAVRNGARWVLALGALLFLLMSVFFGMSIFAGPFFGSDFSPLKVYELSALRIVPYLPLIMGPLAVVTGIVVDVLFYVVNSRAVSTADQVRRRFLTGLTYAESLGNPIVVAAHSQGTVIALDALGRRETPTQPVMLVTAGSPLDSLYQRFLSSTAEGRAESDGVPFTAPQTWMNFSRWGDYIGSGQKRPSVEEVDLGAGGHSGYWSDKALWHKVLQRLSAEERDNR